MELSYIEVLYRFPVWKKLSFLGATTFEKAATSRGDGYFKHFLVTAVKKSATLPDGGPFQALATFDTLRWVLPDYISYRSKCHQ